MFGSELNEATRRIYRGLHGRDHNLHSDIFKRPKQSACDLYVAGPPCQAWSQMGNGAGLDDLAGRGLVFYSCLEYIRDQRPRAVVLENVVGLRNFHPGEFSDILNILEKIGYQETWQILDRCDSGLPCPHCASYTRRARLARCTRCVRQCATLASSLPPSLVVLAALARLAGCAHCARFL